MSATTPVHTTGAARTHDGGRNGSRRVSSETKTAVKTTELVAYVAAVIGVLVASAIVDASDFGAQDAWFLVTLLTIGYMLSRGLAKSGSRDFHDRDENHDH
jgi:hypothetical protein